MPRFDIVLASHLVPWFPTEHQNALRCCSELTMVLQDILNFKLEIQLLNSIQTTNIKLFRPNYLKNRVIKHFLWARSAMKELPSHQGCQESRKFGNRYDSPIYMNPKFKNMNVYMTSDTFHMLESVLWRIEDPSLI